VSSLLKTSMVYLEYHSCLRHSRGIFSSKKLFVNTFLFSEDDLLAADDFMANEQLLLRCISVHGKQAESILRSQFVTPESIHFLNSKTMEAF